MPNVDDLKRTILYVVPPEFIEKLASEAASMSNSGTIDNQQAQDLLAALRLGYRVQAITTLPDGDVLFAVEKPQPSGRGS
jgi:hypothetical protein